MYSLLSVFINYLFFSAMGLCCYMQAFSGSGEQGLLSSCSVQASHCSSFSGTAQALSMQASVDASCKPRTGAQ